MNERNTRQEGKSASFRLNTVTYVPSQAFAENFISNDIVVKRISCDLIRRVGEKYFSWSRRSVGAHCRQMY